ncbi:MAG TPA: decaprenyl-phosphate phosphoribosyltransferase [Vicinamibacterales bacterium]|nr:decaprenyl-phosphate phosphoribosyltransferase [Vicinamibacterales bacterium]
MHLVRAMRPRQWTKNVLVFAGLIFGQKLTDPVSVQLAITAFIVFCLLSSSVYLLNDVHDREADRLHPAKASRPIASGALSIGAAIGAAAVLAAVSLGTAFWINHVFGAVATAYLALMTAYTFWAKHIVILDVLLLAAGFVLRAAGGAAAVQVTFSHWLLLLTLLGALFLGLSKRRAEIVALTHTAGSHRRSLAEYSPYLLDQMISVVTASTLLAYAFYTISPDTEQRFGTAQLIWTVPFPLYGIFRYLYLVHQRDGGGSPSDTLLEDRPVQICVALWAASVVLILYGPWR